MRIYMITPGHGNPCYEIDIEAVMEWFKEAQPGNRFVVNVIEMSEEEYTALPEYMGP